MPLHRPRSNLEAREGSTRLVALAAIAAMVIVGLAAHAASDDADEDEVEAAAERADGGAGEVATVEGEEGEGDGEETAEAPMALPSFADLQPLAPEADVLAHARMEEERLVVGEGGKRRTLTVDPSLQRRMTELLRSYQVPYGAVVAIEPATGRVLALSEFSRDAPGMRGLGLKAVYPAASIFKIVTGAALLEAGVSADQTVCYHGGKRRLQERLLKDNPRRDHRCVTLSQAMGQSANVVFAKLADRKLDGAKLKGWAERFQFNQKIPFGAPVDVSVARIPGSGFELASTAAGFGEVFLSPLHAAMIAASVGNGGELAQPILFEDQPRASRRVLTASSAAVLADMCETTVTQGTARRAFRERGRYALGNVKAAGKTGSLADKKPFRDFSWFVGWAPKDDPKIAVAAVVVNGTIWRVRAPYVGREALRMYLEPQRPLRAAAPRGRKLASR